MNYPNRGYADSCGGSVSYNQPEPCAPSMDPYTLQITNRLSEADKQVNDLTARIYRLNDKLFGPSTTLGKLDPVSVDRAPVPKAMMEQIVGQANILCRKLADLSEGLSRLEVL